MFSEALIIGNGGLDCKPPNHLTANTTLGDEYNLQALLFAKAMGGNWVEPRSFFEASSH